MAKKRIKILTRGPIRVKGFINGPVLTPYFEEISTIFAMISQGIHVVEVCDDRSEVRLTTSNITDDNSKAAREERAALLQPKNEEPETTEEVKPVVETVEEITVTESINDAEVNEVIEDVKPVVEDKVEEVEKAQEAPQQKPYEKSYHNNNYNNNKHNKHNNYKNNNYKKENQIRVETPKTEPIKIGE